jgi:PAS domain-containing protein
MNAFDMQTKRRQAPLQDLILQQKINLAAPTETKEDFDQAYAELYPDGGPDKLSQQAKDIILNRSKEIARSRLPVYDPNDPSTWQNYAQENLTSDYQGDVNKLEAQMDLARLKEEAKLIAQEKRFKEARDALRAKQGFTAEQNAKAIKSREGIAAAGRAESKRKQDKALAEKHLKTVQKLKSAYGSLTRTPDVKRRAIEARDALYVSGDATQIAEFNKAYGTELGLPQKVTPGKAKMDGLKGSGAAPAKANPTAKTFNPSAKYNNGDKVMLPDGRIMIHRNGRWFNK